MEVRISAVIITFNEERNIKRCLESIVGVVDDIVVVDSYSTDATEEICSEFGVKFIKHRFFGHIQQKNWAILQASSPYILSLDADEALSDELRSSILKVKKHWKHDGYYFNRLTNYCGKWIRHTSWYPARKLRLWDSRKGSWGGFNPHDRFLLQKGSARQLLRGNILHYSYYSVSEHIDQINSFSSIMAQSYFERRKKVYISSIILHPLWRLIKDFIVRAGFLDGYYGFIVSVNSAHEVFLKYVKLRNIYMDEKRNNRKTICFFNSIDTWGGGEKWHFDMATYLKSADMRVVLVSSPDSPLSKKCEAMGIKCYSMKVSNLSFVNPLRIWRLLRIFKHEKVGSLISNLSRDMKVAGIAGKLAGVQEIVYRRGSAIPIRDNLMNRFMFRKIITRIIANSLEVKRTILARNSSLVPDRKISIIYNGVQLERYNPGIPKIYEAAKGEIVLGCAGRLSKEKGHDALIELMKLLGESEYRFKMLIAGEGKMLGHLKRKAASLGMEERVKFLGFVENMPAFFNTIDIFLLTSKYEGFSNVIPEAMASSKPVVSFDIKSSGEIIQDGLTGYVTEQNNVREMADRILEIVSDKALMEQMGQNGRKLVEETFSFDKIKEEVMEIIKV